MILDGLLVNIMKQMALENCKEEVFATTINAELAGDAIAKIGGEETKIGSFDGNEKTVDFSEPEYKGDHGYPFNIVDSFTIPLKLELKPGIYSKKVQYAGSEEDRYVTERMQKMGQYRAEICFSDNGRKKCKEIHNDYFVIDKFTTFSQSVSQSSSQSGVQSGAQSDIYVLFTRGCTSNTLVNNTKYFYWRLYGQLKYIQLMRKSSSFATLNYTDQHSVLGDQLTKTTPHQVVIGSNNEENENAILIVGCGNLYGSSKNALTIERENGNAIFYGGLEVKGPVTFTSELDETTLTVKKDIQVGGDLNVKGSVRAENIYPREIKCGDVNGDIYAIEHFISSNKKIPYSGLESDECPLAGEPTAEGKVNFNEWKDKYGRDDGRLQFKDATKLRIPIQSTTLKAGIYIKKLRYETSTSLAQQRLIPANYVAEFEFPSDKEQDIQYIGDNYILITTDMDVESIILYTTNTCEDDFKSSSFNLHWAYLINSECYLCFYITQIDNVTSGIYGDIYDRIETLESTDVQTKKDVNSINSTLKTINTTLASKADKSDIANVYQYRGSVEKFDDLPSISIFKPNGVPTRVEGSLSLDFNDGEKEVIISGKFDAESSGHTEAMHICIPDIELDEGYYVVDVISEGLIGIHPNISYSCSISKLPQSTNSRYSLLIDKSTMIYVSSNIRWLSLEMRGVDLSADIDAKIKGISFRKVNYNDELGMNPENYPIITIGSVYNVLDGGMNYAWTGTEWDALGGISNNIGGDAYANALKATASGNVISVNDVSPIEHTVKVSVRSDENIIKPASGFSGFSGRSVSWKNDDDPAFIIDISPEYSNIESDYAAANNRSQDKYDAGTYSFSIYGLNPEDYAFVKNYDTNTLLVSDIKDGNPGIFTINESSAIYFYVHINQGSVYDQRTITPVLTQVPTNVTITRYGADENDHFQTFTSLADGTVEIPSLSPSMTILTYDESVIIDCEYNQDINKQLGDIESALDYIRAIQDSLIGGDSV